MTHFIRHTNLLILGIITMLCVSSCYDLQNEREVCDYKIQLRYDYNEENTAYGNMIEYYIHEMDEYVFDEDGILYQYRHYTSDRCTEYLHSELDLPPGRYSVLAIGNMDDRSVISDAKDGTRSGNVEPIVGVTHRNSLLMSLKNSEQVSDNMWGPCEKLYYGYKSFTVKERGISRVRVDMINAHFRLKFRMTWKRSRGGTPPKTDEYFATLGRIPSGYKLMPEWLYPAGEHDCRKHDPEAYDDYPTACNRVIHHIPYTCYGKNNILTYRVDTYINADSEMWGEFVTYRVKTATRPVLRIFRKSDGEQIVKDIDLQGYFEWYGYKMDQVLKQDYELNIVIDGDKVIITPLDIADWDEGGVI